MGMEVHQWDGFDESRDNILDGEGFRLDIGFTDGTSIHANGDNAFPKDYYSAISQMQEILDGMEPEQKTGSDLGNSASFYQESEYETER